MYTWSKNKDEEWEKMSTRNNMSTKFIKKFQEEWEETTEHLKKTRYSQIFAVDFDGTLSLGKWPGIGKPNLKLIQFLRERKAKGDKIILYTAFLVLLGSYVWLYKEYKKLAERYKTVVTYTDCKEEEVEEEAIKEIQQYCRRHSYDKCGTCKYANGYQCGFQYCRPQGWNKIKQKNTAYQTNIRRGMKAR